MSGDQPPRKFLGNPKYDSFRSASDSTRPYYAPPQIPRATPELFTINNPAHSSTSAPTQLLGLENPLQTVVHEFIARKIEEGTRVVYDYAQPEPQPVPPPINFRSNSPSSTSDRVRDYCNPSPPPNYRPNADIEVDPPSYRANADVEVYPTNYRPTADVEVYPPIYRPNADVEVDQLLPDPPNFDFSAPLSDHDMDGRDPPKFDFSAPVVDHIDVDVDSNRRTSVSSQEAQSLPKYTERQCTRSPESHSHQRTRSPEPRSRQRARSPDPHCRRRKESKNDRKVSYYANGDRKDDYYRGKPDFGHRRSRSRSRSPSDTRNPHNRNTKFNQNTRGRAQSRYTPTAYGHRQRGKPFNSSRFNNRSYSNYDKDKDSSKAYKSKEGYKEKSSKFSDRGRVVSRYPEKESSAQEMNRERNNNRASLENQKASINAEKIPVDGGRVQNYAKDKDSFNLCDTNQQILPFSQAPTTNICLVPTPRVSPYNDVDMRENLNGLVNFQGIVTSAPAYSTVSTGSVPGNFFTSASLVVGSAPFGVSHQPVVNSIPGVIPSITNIATAYGCSPLDPRLDPRRSSINTRRFSGESSTITPIIHSSATTTTIYSNNHPLPTPGMAQPSKTFALQLSNTSNLDITTSSKEQIHPTDDCVPTAPPSNTSTHTYKPGNNPVQPSSITSTTTPVELIVAGKSGTISEVEKTKSSDVLPSVQNPGHYEIPKPNGPLPSLEELLDDGSHDISSNLSSSPTRTNNNVFPNLLKAFGGTKSSNIENLQSVPKSVDGSLKPQLRLEKFSATKIEKHTKDLELVSSTVTSNNTQQSTSSLGAQIVGQYIKSNQVSSNHDLMPYITGRANTMSFPHEKFLRDEEFMNITACKSHCQQLLVGLGVLGRFVNTHPVERKRDPKLFTLLQNIVKPQNDSENTLNKENQDGKLDKGTTSVNEKQLDNKSMDIENPSSSLIESSPVVQEALKPPQPEQPNVIICKVTPLGKSVEASSSSSKKEKQETVRIKAAAIPKQHLPGPRSISIVKEKISVQADTITSKGKCPVPQSNSGSQPLPVHALPRRNSESEGVSGRGAINKEGFVCPNALPKPSNTDKTDQRKRNVPVRNASKRGSNDSHSKAIERKVTKQNQVSTANKSTPSAPDLKQIPAYPKGRKRRAESQDSIQPSSKRISLASNPDFVKSKGQKVSQITVEPVLSGSNSKIVNKIVPESRTAAAKDIQIPEKCTQEVGVQFQQVLTAEASVQHHISTVEASVQHHISTAEAFVQYQISTAEACAQSELSTAEIGIQSEIPTKEKGVQMHVVTKDNSSQHELSTTESSCDPLAITPSQYVPMNLLDLENDLNNARLQYEETLNAGPTTSSTSINEKKAYLLKMVQEGTADIVKCAMKELSYVDDSLMNEPSASEDEIEKNILMVQKAQTIVSKRIASMLDMVNVLKPVLPDPDKKPYPTSSQIFSYFDLLMKVKDIVNYSHLETRILSVVVYRLARILKTFGFNDGPFSDYIGKNNMQNQLYDKAALDAFSYIMTDGDNNFTIALRDHQTGGIGKFEAIFARWLTKQNMKEIEYSWDSKLRIENICSLAGTSAGEAIVKIKLEQDAINKSLNDSESEKTSNCDDDDNEEEEGNITITYSTFPAVVEPVPQRDRKDRSVFARPNAPVLRAKRHTTRASTAFSQRQPTIPEPTPSTSTSKPGPRTNSNAELLKKMAQMRKKESAGTSASSRPIPESRRVQNQDNQRSASGTPRNDSVSKRSTPKEEPEITPAWWWW